MLITHCTRPLSACEGSSVQLACVTGQYRYKEAWLLRESVDLKEAPQQSAVA